MSDFLPRAKRRQRIMEDMTYLKIDSICSSSCSKLEAKLKVAVEALEVLREGRSSNFIIAGNALKEIAEMDKEK